MHTLLTSKVLPFILFLYFITTVQKYIKVNFTTVSIYIVMKIVQRAKMHLSYLRRLK